MKRHLPNILGKLQDHGVNIEFDDTLRDTVLDWTSYHGDVNPCEGKTKDMLLFQKTKLLWSKCINTIN